MVSTRNRLYLFLFLACVAGYGWVGLLLNETLNGSPVQEVCLLKKTTGYPCPSCGTSRSVMSLLQHQNWWQAAQWNPMGYVVAALMLVLPPWLIFDVVIGRQSLFITYRKIEFWLKKPWLAGPLIVLVLANWIWNIIKGL